MQGGTRVETKGKEKRMWIGLLRKREIGRENWTRKLGRSSKVEYVGLHGCVKIRRTDLVGDATEGLLSERGEEEDEGGRR